LPVLVWLAPLWVDGDPVLVPESGMDPCGRGAKREGANMSEFERFGVTGPVGVEPMAGAPRVIPGEVAPPVPVLVPEPVPPDPDV
jgi:hypothetical protein